MRSLRPRWLRMQQHTGCEGINQPPQAFISKACCNVPGARLAAQMSDANESTAELDKWLAALRKRDELQDLLQGLESLVHDGSIKRSSVEEVKDLLAAAQREVDQLQACIMAL
jgi:hypothetical protein